MPVGKVLIQKHLFGKKGGNTAKGQAITNANHPDQVITVEMVNVFCEIQDETQRFKKQKDQRYSVDAPETLTVDILFNIRFDMRVYIPKEPLKLLHKKLHKHEIAKKPKLHTGILTTVVFAHKRADGKIKAGMAEIRVSLTMFSMKYIMNRTNE